VHRPRIEWDACDITIPEGRIEVKAGGYIQAWDQRALSKVVFSGLKARTWTPAARHSAEATYNADAYVFAVVTAIDHDTYNALDTEGWQFWVLPASVVASTNQASMALSRVQTLCTSPIGYEELAAAIRAALANAKD